MKKITFALICICVLGGGNLVHADEDLSGLEIEAAVQIPTDSYLERVWDGIFYSLSLVGIKYRWGGSSPNTGFDCSGFVAHVYKKMTGLVLPHNSHSIAKVGTAVPMSDLKPGDLVFFNTMRRPFSHVGIYLGEKRFVHAAATGKHVDIADMSKSYWTKRYNGARRISR
jgi:cell wall-associated NlpC family hydrolase